MNYSSTSVLSLLLYIGQCVILPQPLLDLHCTQWCTSTTFQLFFKTDQSNERQILTLLTGKQAKDETGIIVMGINATILKSAFSMSNWCQVLYNISYGYENLLKNTTTMREICVNKRFQKFCRCAHNYCAVKTIKICHARLEGKKGQTQTDKYQLRVGFNVQVLLQSLATEECSVL